MRNPNRRSKFLIKHSAFIILLMLTACFSKKPVTRPTPNKPKPTADLPYGKMDTVELKNKPGKTIPSPGGGIPGGSGSPVDPSKTYRIALVLPFQSNKFDETEGAALPKSSSIALQFYAGAKAALMKMSSDPNSPQMTVDVLDSKVADADFLAVLKNPTLAKADVVIGGFRNSQVTALADWGKLNGKIILSPDIATPGLATKNPNFIQLNPSLRAHCAAMLKKALLTHKPDEIVLVCKEKERDRLAFFQENSPGARFSEVVVPDATELFTTDLKPFFKPGKSTVFLVPHWSSQDFINSFFQKIKAQRGKTPVEIIGMPQWKNFENIEADDFESLNVSLAMARFRKENDPELADFYQKFLAETGTAPDDDALNGFDSMMFLSKMLRKNGLDFPKKLGGEKVRGLSSQFAFSKNGLDGAVDFWENSGVFVVKYVNGRFEE